MKCLRCNGKKLALLLISSLTSEDVLNKECDVAYCYDCHQVVEIDQMITMEPKK